ncbi:hypothetical protein WJX73_005388 [Symbiochloris irregularis]|uniref:Uncharacterized protein n=1 Tax=Symbiochloris irregularis TaxID=706552 RepID=A0AAW1Q1E0_9CHLO
MLHSRRVFDENSVAPASAKAHRDAENPALPGKTASKAPRKALGNITNVTGRTDKAAFGKTPSTTQAPPRKAPLGDITNSKLPPRQPAPKQVAREDVPALQLPAPKSRLDLLAEQYAKDGIEQLAGKGWNQLQRDAELRQDLEIAARVAAITSIPYRVPVAHLSQGSFKVPRKPLQAVPQPPSPQMSPRGDDDWDNLTLSQKAAQLPDLPLDDNWGIRESVFHAEENDLSGRQHDANDDFSTEMRWPDDPGAAWQDL